jgi:hypothetical protein
MADPGGRKIHSAAVTAEFDSFFNHLFTENLELYLTFEGLRGNILINIAPIHWDIFVIFIHGFPLVIIFPPAASGKDHEARIHPVMPWQLLPPLLSLHSGIASGIPAAAPNLRQITSLLSVRHNGAGDWIKEHERRR